MTIKTIIIILINLLIAVGLISVAFKSFKNFKKSIYYFVYPDIASIIKKDYDNDFAYTHRLLFILVVLFVLVLVEIRLFY